jgi:hypothetical protein
MTRKDPEKEPERPHYYSQFWLDVAAGRRTIGSKSASSETEDETERELPEPPKSSRSTRDGSASATRRSGAAAEPVRGGLTSLADLGLVIGGHDTQDAETEATLDEETADMASSLPDIAIDADLDDLDALAEEEGFAEEEPEEDLDFDDTFFDEEEEDEWGMPRSRKSSPRSKPKKQSPRRRERGRDF